MLLLHETGGRHQPCGQGSFEMERFVVEIKYDSVIRFVSSPVSVNAPGYLRRSNLYIIYMNKPS